MGDQDPQMLPAAEHSSEGEEDENKPKKRQKLDRPVDKWTLFPFPNSARSDNLRLRHWVKEKEQDEPYQFARFNKKPEVIRYTDEEYKKVCASLANDPYCKNNLAYWQDWTKQETDLLFDLCERFQMRFIVIADRF